MCTIIDKEGGLGLEEVIDGETNDMQKGHDILSMIIFLVLSASITLRNLFQ